MCPNFWLLLENNSTHSCRAGCLPSSIVHSLGISEHWICVNRMEHWTEFTEAVTWSCSVLYSTAKATETLLMLFPSATAARATSIAFSHSLLHSIWSFFKSGVSIQYLCRFCYLYPLTYRHTYLVMTGARRKQLHLWTKCWLLLIANNSLFPSYLKWTKKKGNFWGENLLPDCMHCAVN